MTPVQQLINIIKWTPSGDNEQPWEFNVLSPNTFEFSLKDTRNYYNFDGRMTALTAGMLTASIEEASFSLSYWAKIEGNTVTLTKYVDKLNLPVLGDYIEARKTNRGLYARDLLSNVHKETLNSIPEVVWLPDRFKMARLNAKASFIKLKEAYEHHKKVIDFRNSGSGVPAATLNLDPITLKIMYWAMQDFDRLKRLPKLVPILEMDFLPSLFCATHYAIEADDDFTGGHRAMRFMLLAEQLGLQHQPMMAPLILTRKGIMKDDIFNPRTVWVGRIGYGNDPTYRAERK